MKKSFISPQSFAQKIAILDFKDWVLKIYKHAWHTLGNTELWEAVNDYNKTHGIQVNKFWD